MKQPKAQYVTVAPVTSKGKWTICMRRVGTRDRLTPIAVAHSELHSELIVDGLNAMQGEIAKLEAPAQKSLELALKQGNELRATIAQLRTDISAERSKMSILKQQFDMKCNEVGRLQVALTAAQKQAVESA